MCKGKDINEIWIFNILYVKYLSLINNLKMEKKTITKGRIEVT